VPEIIQACRSFKDKSVTVEEIPSALHGDMIQLEGTFAVLERLIRSWF
jgi:hypothetical protein